jgi:lantibiotic modifying enzyme
LGSDDRRRELRFMSLSFRGLNMDRRIRDLEIDSTTLTADEAVREASAIAGLIDSLAYSSRSGKFWFGIVHDSDRADLKDLGDGLYLGAAGPAVLHAALYAVTGGRQHQAAAMACLERSLRRLARRSPAARLRMRADGCGIGGLGGITYALAICAHLLDSPELRLATARAADAMYPPRASGVGTANLVSGSSGAVAALLAAHRLIGGRGPLDRAAAWADRLVHNRTRDPRSGFLAWSDQNGDFRPGLGKGVAGIARVLTDLHQDTGRTELLDAAAESWMFVDSTQDSARGGWPSPFRPGDEEHAPAVQRAWCLGSSGIGLAATASHPVLAGMKSRIEHALDHLRSLDQAGVTDNCCCGYGGHLDLLLGAGRALERPELTTEAHSVASTIARKARRRGSYDTGYGAVYAPGFFKGLAGIGYQMLRLHHGVALPSVLLLESTISAWSHE